MPLPLNSASKFPTEQWAQTNTMLMEMISDPIYDSRAHYIYIKDDLIAILSAIPQNEASPTDAIIVPVCYHNINLAFNRNELRMDSVRCPVSILKEFKQAIQEKFPSALIFTVDWEVFLDEFEMLSPLINSLSQAEYRCTNGNEPIFWVEEFQLVIDAFEKHPNEMQDALVILPAREEFYLLDTKLKNTMPLITSIYAKNATPLKLYFRINLAKIIMSCYRLMRFSQ